jgi:hypothetical protein
MEHHLGHGWLTERCVTRQTGTAPPPHRHAEEALTIEQARGAKMRDRLVGSEELSERVVHLRLVAEWAR